MVTGFVGNRAKSQVFAPFARDPSSGLGIPADPERGGVCACAGNGD